MELSSDVPITLPRQDRLRRKHFAEAIAKAVIRWDKNESVVLGLFGGWGSGKSSVKNLALHYLSQEAEPCPVVHFNPWLVSGEEHLAESFFREIAIALSLPVAGEKGEKAAKRLSKFAAYASVIAPLTEQALNVCSAVGVPGAGLAAIGVKAAKAGSKALGTAADAQAKLAQGAQKSLADLRDDLKTSLLGLKRPILVVVDDIDRLASEEICLLFRLIKANADFPKFVYLILCDRGFVSESLERLASKRGAEFLEKIVQVGFDLPEPTWDDLVGLASAEWAEIKKSSPDAVTRSNIKRWNELIQMAQPYLRHVRAVRRWMNAVRFSFAFFKKRGGFDANPEDILGLELLRIHEPVLYQNVARNHFALTGQPWMMPSSIDEQDWRNSYKDSLFKSVAPERSLEAEAIVNWLFPKAIWFGDQFGENHLLRDLRVGEGDCFQRYFQLTLEDDVVTRRELQAGIRVARNASSFAELLRQEMGRGRLSVFLNHLKAHAAAMARYAQSALEGLFEVGDEFPSKYSQPKGWGLSEEAEAFALTLLGEIEKDDDRSVILEQAVANAKGIMLPTRITNTVIQKHRRSKAYMTDEALERVKKSFLAKVQEFKESPTLRKAWQVGGFLRTWQLCDGIEGPRAWLRAQLEDSVSILQVLRSAASIQASSGEWNFSAVDAKWLFELVGLEAMNQAVLKVTSSGLVGEDKVLPELYETSRAAFLEKQTSAAKE
jgi:predicted KAP-like P-loop ATPase